MNDLIYLIWMLLREAGEGFGGILTTSNPLFLFPKLERFGEGVESDCRAN